VARGSRKSKRQTKRGWVESLRVTLDRWYCAQGGNRLGVRAGVVVGRTPGGIVMGTNSNAISPWEHLLAAALDSPYANLEFGEFGWARPTNALTSTAKVTD